MRAAIDTRARRLDRKIYLAAARAIAAEIGNSVLEPVSILPSPLSATLYPNVAEATLKLSWKGVLLGAVQKKGSWLMIHGGYVDLSPSAKMDLREYVPTKMNI